MIDFLNINVEYLDDIKNLVQKNVEKSELANLSLFTINPIDKARIFIFCYNFLNTIYKLIEDDDANNPDSFKKQLKKEIDLTKSKYETVYGCLMKINSIYYNNHRYMDIINSEILKDNIVNDLRDTFAIFLERTNILSISKTQGIILEGKSKEEYDKIFKGKAPSSTSVEELEELEELTNESEHYSDDVENSEENEESNIEVIVKDDESYSEEDEISEETRERELLT